MHVDQAGQQGLVAEVDHLCIGRKPDGARIGNAGNPPFGHGDHGVGDDLAGLYVDHSRSGDMHGFGGGGRGKHQRNDSNGE
jgi:hypothetical protein